jgi:hypothetical protein
VKGEGLVNKKKIVHRDFGRAVPFAGALKQTNI